MRKGEIACYKQFLLFSQCFPRLYTLVRKNSALCGNGLINLYSLQFLYLSCLAVLRIPVFLMKVAESLPKKSRKQYFEKQKLLITSNFSFSHRLVLQTRKNQGLSGKGLTAI